MDKKKLLKEYKHLKLSVINKTKFMYSKEFYELSDLDKLKYTTDKFTAEIHLASLSSLLFSEKAACNSLQNIFAFGILNQIFNGSYCTGEFMQNSSAKSDNKEQASK